MRCFPGRSGSPLSYASFATAPAKAGIDACTPHGWRSCFRDWCGDIGDVPRELAEAALAHSLNATEGAYRRMTAVERWREVMTRRPLAERRARQGPRLPYRQYRLSCSTVTFISTDEE
jgi:integrase